MWLAMLRVLLLLQDAREDGFALVGGQRLEAFAGGCGQRVRGRQRLDPLECLRP